MLFEDVGGGNTGEWLGASLGADVRRERLMKEAQKDPAVQEALDLFDGRLVDVREAKPGQ